MTEPAVQAMDDVYQPLPFEEGQVLEGDPRGVCIMLCETPELSIGIWKCTPGSFNWSYDSEETLYVFRGSASVRVHGSDEIIELKPGGAVTWPAGTKVTWTVKEEIEKVFCVKA